MASTSTGRSFRATEKVAALLRDLLDHQFPEHRFALVLLPYHEKTGLYSYELHIEAPYCPEDVQRFIDDYLARLFPNRSHDRTNVL